LKKNSLLIYLTLLFVLFFDLWVENSEQAQAFFGNWIEPITDEPKFSVVWTVLLIIAFYIGFRDKLHKVEEDRDQLQQRLNSEMEILVMANLELNKYRLQENLVAIFDRFVAKNSYVLAVQFYYYQEKNLQGKVTFKLNYSNGSAAAQVNVNAIQQLTYEGNLGVIKSFRKAKTNFKEHGSPFDLVDFVIQTYHDLKETAKDEYSKEDALACSLMFLALEILEREYELSPSEFLMEDEGKLNNLIDNHRTGLLRAAIMNDDFYSFTHTKDNDKFNRQYIARLVELRNEKTLFSIVLDNSILEDEDYEEILKEIADEFEILLIELESMYNDNRERLGDSNENH
jgi:hypothetical protein